MGYVEDQTDKAVEELEKELTRHYKRAYKAIEKTSAEYMVKFEERDKELRELLKNDKEAYRKKYCVGASLYMTPEEHYKQWRLAQIGRGKRWEAVKDEIARAMVNANKEAAKIINKMTPGVYELNSNYTAYVIETGTGTAFNLLDQDTVDELTQGNHTDFKTVRVNPTRDYSWNSKRIQDALTSGILQGQSIPHLTQAFMAVMGSNRKAAIRNARTAMTSAQNAGALSRYKEAQALGIEMQKEWISTHDARVRDSHAQLDGVRVKLDEKFPNGLVCPGDPQGRPEEVYNCRCAMRSILPKRNDVRRTNNTVESYQEWLANKTADLDKKGKNTYTENEIRKMSLRAQEILRESRSTKQMELIKKVADEEMKIKSYYSGKTTIKNLNVPGKYNPRSGNIYLDPNASLKNKIHEMIHSYTKYVGNGNDVFANIGLNEITTEIIARKICKNENIPFKGSYEKGVLCFSKIAELLEKNTEEYAKSIYMVPRNQRVEAVQNDIEIYLKNNLSKLEEYVEMGELLDEIRWIWKKKKI